MKFHNVFISRKRPPNYFSMDRNNVNSFMLGKTFEGLAFFNPLTSAVVAQAADRQVTPALLQAATSETASPI